MARLRNFKESLEDQVFELILRFPGRIDEMETRSEENCRDLAARIAELVKRELERRGIDRADG